MMSILHGSGVRISPMNHRLEARATLYVRSR